MLGKLEEMKLLALCMATDNREAFSRLVEAYQPMLKRFLVNLNGGDAALADDLAQDTFIKAWMGIRNFQGLSGFKTWLYRIAINEFSSYRRKRSVNMEISNDDASNRLPRFNEPMEKPHSNTENRLDVATLLGMLPEKERTVCLLYYLEDLPVKKISRITSMPEGTVKSHLNRARAHLAKAVEH